MSLHNEGSQAIEGELENPTTVPTPIKELDKQNGYIVLEGHPCKIKGIYKVRNGFKGSKTQIVGSDIFTKKEYAQSFSNLGMADVPVIKRTDYALCGIEENKFVALMNTDGEMREDLRLPTSAEKGDLAEKIINAYEANQNVVVTVMEACGQEMIVDLKEDN